ncbi:MAG TPA: MoxR family ATPase [Polyangiaceae bacterium]
MQQPDNGQHAPNDPERTASSINEELIRFCRDIDELKRALAEVIVGQSGVIDAVLTGMIAAGHLLIEGVPGVGKTMLVRQLARALGLQSSRIQFTPDLMPADILGTTVIAEATDHGTRRLEFQPGPIFANLVLADEINRATPKTQSALLEAMQERSVTIGGKTYPIEEPFFVLATENPVEMEGTYPLPEAQLDRFLMKIDVPFPNALELAEILTRTTGGTETEVRFVIDGSRLLEMIRFARQCPVADHVRDYVVRIVRATHPGLESTVPRVKRYVRLGASPRGAQALLNCAKIRAVASGRLIPSLDDVRAMAKPTLRHRLLLSFEGQADRISTEELLDEIVEKLPETA